jgi:hypothetical protein
VTHTISVNKSLDDNESGQNHTVRDFFGLIS